MVHRQSFKQALLLEVDPRQSKLRAVHFKASY